MSISPLGPYQQSKEWRVNRGGYLSGLSVWSFHRVSRQYCLTIIVSTISPLLIVQTVFLACVSLVFIIIFREKGQTSFTVVWATTLGYIIFEVLQPYLNLGVFDFLDILATLLGGMTALVAGFVER